MRPVFRNEQDSHHFIMPSPLEPSVVGCRFDSPQGMCVMTLLMVLRQYRGPRTKADVIDAIKLEGWFDLLPEDLRRYPQGNSNEPRWVTLVCWARNLCADHGLISRDQRDAWESTTEGKNQAVKISQHFRENIADLRKCWWWKPEKKRELNPGYTPSSGDALRPPYVYEDSIPIFRRSVRGREGNRASDERLAKLLAEYRNPNTTVERRDRLREVLELSFPEGP